MKKFLKILGYAFAGIIALVLIVCSISYMRTEKQMNRACRVQPAAITIPTDSASIAWGKHIAETHGCMNCHKQNMVG